MNGIVPLRPAASLRKVGAGTTFVFPLPAATEKKTVAQVVVAVMDRGRGPVMRTVARTALTDRAEAGPDDQALRFLVRRTPPPVHTAARGGSGREQRRAGHKRAAMHRTTGK